MEGNLNSSKESILSRSLLVESLVENEIYSSSSRKQRSSDSKSARNDACSLIERRGLNLPSIEQ